jgi:hypothetical protein
VTAIGADSLCWLPILQVPNNLRLLWCGISDAKVVHHQVQLSLDRGKSGGRASPLLNPRAREHHD